MLNKILEKIFLGNDKNSASPLDDTITRQELLDEIYCHFLMRFREETTTESILFPTSYCIYMHEKDYQKQEQTFFRTAKDAANKFHRILKEKLNSYPDYIPHSTYWLFQFTKYVEGNIIDYQNQSINAIQIGTPVIVSTIFAMDFSKNNISNESNIRATVHNKRSDTIETLNINMDAFLGMEIEAKDRIRIDFSKNFDKLSESSVSKQTRSEIAFATLRCDANFLTEHGQKGNKYQMTTDLIEISGRNDVRRNDRVVRIDHDEINDSHVQIKYLPGENRFKLAVFDENVILNEREIEKSSGGDIYWVNLPNNSSIFINGEIQINFTINK